MPTQEDAVDDVLRWLETQQDASERALCELLKIPSVSADPAFAGDVARCAEWLAAWLGEAGFRARTEATGGHPAVVAEWRGAPGAPTVLVYGHYDVQPAVVGDGWATEPFEPQVRDGVLVARGASDDKGQVFAHCLGAAAHLKVHGKLPVNLVFLVEGEEESGSEHLEVFVEANRERLACDAVIVSDSAQFATGVPAITYGLRGLCYVEVTLRGPARDLHSGSFGGAVRNPANALAAMVAALHDADGRVTVPGFYDDVLPLQPWEREAFAALPFDREGFLQGLGVTEDWGETGYSILERLWARPTLDVNGLWSGYTGDGAKTVLPSRASAKISCRLVPDQDPETIADRLEERLRALCPPGCGLTFHRHHAARPVLVPVEEEAVRAAADALERGFGARPVFTREGGSIPVVETFRRVLDAPVVLMGFGRPDDGAHGPDEKLHLEDFHAGARTSAWLWHLLANGGTP